MRSSSSNNSGNNLNCSRCNKISYKSKSLVTESIIATKVTVHQHPIFVRSGLLA